MKKFQNQATKPLAVASIVGPSYFIYSASAAHIQNNLPIIGEALDISPTTASWLVNIEVLICIVTTTFTGKLCQRHGSVRIFTLGIMVFAMFNILYSIPQVQQSFVAAVCLRVGTSIGLGLFLPSGTPMANQLVIPGKLGIVISIGGVIAPVGAVLTALVAGLITQATNWRVLFIIIGALSLVVGVACLFALDFKKAGNKSVRIDYLGSCILSLSICMLVVGLTFLSSTSFPKWAAIVLVVVALLLLVFFAYYNHSLSKQPIFQVELFNKNTSLTLLLILLANTNNYLSRYFEAYVYQVIEGKKPATSGYFMAITGIGSIVFAPLGNLLQRRVIAKRVIMLTGTVMLCCVILNILQLQYFFTIPMYIIVNFLFVGANLMTVVALSSYNYAQAPLRYSNQIGVITQVMTNSAHSLGVTLAVLINKAALKKGEPTLTHYSVSMVYVTSSLLCFVIIMMALFLGTFKFERGKKGFKEMHYQQTVTFEDNLIADKELQQVDESQAAQMQEPKIERILKLFNNFDQM